VGRVEQSAHQDAGRRAYIVTAASQELAEVLAHVLMMDGGLGMRSEVVGSRTGPRQACRWGYRRIGLPLPTVYMHLRMSGPDGRDP